MKYTLTSSCMIQLDVLKFIAVKTIENASYQNPLQLSVSTWMSLWNFCDSEMSILIAWSLGL